MIDTDSAEGSIMASRATLVQMAAAVAAEISAGKSGPNAKAVAAFLYERPEAALDLIEMAAAESRKKRPNTRRIGACCYMAGEALRSARMAMESGRREAAQLIESCRNHLIAVGKSGRIKGSVLIGLVAEFSEASIDPGPELRDVVDAVMRAEAEARPIEELGPHGTGAAAQANMLGLLEQCARQLGDDPFVVQSALQEQFGALPDNQRAGLAEMLLEMNHQPLRECVPGWLLDNSPLVRGVVGEALERAAGTGRVSGSMLRRMIAVRNWLPDGEGAALERAIQVCRTPELGITAGPRPKIHQVVGSIIDGAGAQTVAVMVQEGRRYAIGMILLKQGFGVRDAWVRGGMTRAQAQHFLDGLEEVEVISVSLDYMRTAVANGLGVQRNGGEMPPFWLIQVLELAGLDGVQPCILPPEEILGRLENEAGRGSLSPIGTEQLLIRSRDLVPGLPMLESWFQCDDSVGEVLRQRRLSRSKSVCLVQEQVLPRHVESWVERLAWSALTLRDCEGAPWRELVATARALQAGRPIAEIPVMAHVAAMTVEAFRAQERADWL